MVNKKAQTGIIAWIFSLVLFLLFWFVYLGGLLNQIGQNAIIDNNLTGLEAFAYANLNLWVALVLLLALFFFATFGGSR
jgi:hypothetical protein